MKYMTKSQFARHCGVSPTAVDKAIKTGSIAFTEGEGVNPKSTKNKRYRRNAKERKLKLAKGRGEQKSQSNGAQNFLDITPLILESDVFNSNSNSDASTDGDEDDPTPSEIDYAIEKMRSTTALNKARLAEMVKATIRRDFVDKVIGLIGTSISDHLLTMGDRMATDLAAIAGSTDPVVVRKIKESIDGDVSASLQEMKRVVHSQYTEKLQE